MYYYILSCGLYYSIYLTLGLTIERCIILLLNQRQLEILLELFEKPEVYMTASYFSSKHQCSLRTIQNDIRQIKTELESTNCVIFESTTRKGCRILIQDSSLFSALKDSYYQQFSSATLNYPNGRVNQILHLLLKEHRAISLYDLESAVFVSRSTLLNDLKGVSEVVARYNLELLRSSNKVIIDGSEINKRLCLMDQNLIITNTVAALSEQGSNSSIEKIKNILVETFVSFKHPITEAYSTKICTVSVMAKNVKKSLKTCVRNPVNTSNWTELNSKMQSSSVKICVVPTGAMVLPYRIH